MAIWALITKALPSLAKIGERISEVVFGERRMRVRNQLARLKRIREKLMRKPPSLKRARKSILLDDKIKELKNYLMNK